MELPCRLSWHVRKGCPFQVRAGTFVRRLGKFVWAAQRVGYHTAVLELGGRGRGGLQAWLIT